MLNKSFKPIRLSLVVVILMIGGGLPSIFQQGVALTASRSPDGISSNEKSVSDWYPTNPTIEYPALISDNIFVYSPNVLDFDIGAFLSTQSGPLQAYSEKVDGQIWMAEEIIGYNAFYFEINPQVILTILEAENGLITNPNAQIPLSANHEDPQSEIKTFYYHVNEITYKLLTAYESHRYNQLDSIIPLKSGQNLNLPLNINAGTYAIQEVLAQVTTSDKLEGWISGMAPEFDDVFKQWFGDPLLNLYTPQSIDALPVGYILPFPIGETWYFTGGPHNYGGGDFNGCVSGSGCPRPWSSIDIAPPGSPSCSPGETTYLPNRWIVAARGGKVTKSAQGLVVINHSDGWYTHYSHVSSTDRVSQGSIVKQGDHLGHPSCETEPGGSTSGIHVHFAFFSYSVNSFVDISFKSLSNWVIQETTHYNGTMTHNFTTRTAITEHINGTNDILNSGYNGPIPGDGNGDRKVDGLDYVIWLNHYQPGIQTNGGATVGDYNNDGFVDGLDYVLWLNNYQMW